MITQSLLRKSTKYVDVLIGIALLFVLGLVMAPLFRGELMRSHDIEYHAVRVANYYLALKQGQFPPRWAPNLNGGLGYPVFLFMYPLPYILASVGYAATSSVEWGINLTIGFFISSGFLGMFCLSYLLQKHGEKLRGFKSFLVCCTYLLAPYSLLNIYVRGALGEIAFFGLLPWMVLVMSKREYIKQWYGIPTTALLVTAFLLSHHLSVMLAAPLLALYFFLNGKHEWKKYAWSTLVGTFMSLWFWIPLLFEKQFTIVDKQASVQNYWKEFIGIKNLLWTSWGYGGFTPGSNNEGFAKMIGPVVLCIVGATFLLLKTKTKMQKFWLTCFAISVFLITPYSTFVWEIFPFLKVMQFPWRLLWITTFSGAMLLHEFLQQNQKVSIVWQRVISFFILAFSLFSLLFWAKPVATFKNTEHYWLEYSLTGSAYQENLPIWLENTTVPPIDKVTSTHSETKLETSIHNWNGSRMQYTIELPEKSPVTQRTAYFPGWEVMIDGVKTNISPNEGLITFDVEAGRHEVLTQFTEHTPARTVGNLASIAGILAWLGSVAYTIIKRKSRHA